jgi:CRP-like cAMP-binding protein
MLTRAWLDQSAILRHLNDCEAARVLEAGALIEMPTGYGIYRADEAIREVYFPIDCVLSVVTQMKNGEAIEVGTIGREGTSGIPLLMGGATTANDCYCQVPGRAIKMSADDFHHLRTVDQTFRALLDRYLQAYVNFLGQLTGCNRLHSVYERCARWLLLTHDRVGRNEILLTHEYLAMMLGSRRSGVTIGLATLQRAGYIRYAHGCITMLDRTGLEETTCECYALAQKQFTGFLQPANGSNNETE